MCGCEAERHAPALITNPNLTQNQTQTLTLTWPWP